MRNRPIIAALCFPLIAGAQAEAPEPAASPTPIKVQAWERKLSGPKEGAMLPQFSGMAMNGTPFTLNQLQQRISLVMFWYPSCNCISPEMVEPFKEFLSNPRFQIVSIMQDSFYYSRFVQEKTIPGLHVNLASFDKFQEVSMGGPYPSVMLVDGSGKVLKASNAFHKGYFDTAEWIARLREALLF